MPGHPTETVVRIIGHSIERGEILLRVADAITVRVLHTQQPIPLREVDPAVRPAFDVHGGVGIVVKDAPVLAVRIENQHLVVLRSVVVAGTKMRVAGDRPDISLLIHVDARGRHKIGMLGQQREFHPGLQRLDLRRQFGRNLGRLVRSGSSCVQGNARSEKEGQQVFHVGQA